jgi:hypothetical protein
MCYLKFWRKLFLIENLLLMRYLVSQADTRGNAIGSAVSETEYTKHHRESRF